ncbi:MAG TPA: DUF3006 family protein [Bacillota bacterium]|nr:DUF3006 family protein [Bacillota bacterium]HOH09934.1 DUF3006 family protein [Bacillota bacterium]HOS50711.1 DUF3006 family protein [Bacillota bacterium]HOY88585.1 DUF3006 family protein [Bacillota bacterium]HPI01991.1 DUF3006 family protein [Bacillota bacterium]
MRAIFAIDRMEDKKCVIIDCADPSISAVWPLEALPEGAAEGDLLVFTIDLDKSGRKEEEQKVKGIIKDLLERSGR